MKLLSEVRRSDSIKVPGVITSVTPLFTIPFAFDGSSSCSQMTTL